MTHVLYDDLTVCGRGQPDAGPRSGGEAKIYISTELFVDGRSTHRGQLKAGSTSPASKMIAWAG